MLHWAVLGAALLASVAEGQSRFDIDYVESIEPLSYVAHRTAGAIDIDGNLDEPSWQRADWTAPFVDIEGERKPVPAPTDASQDAVGRRVSVYSRRFGGAARVGYHRQARCDDLPRKRL